MQKRIYGILTWTLSTLFVVYSFSLDTAAAVFSDTVKSALVLNNTQVTFALSAFIIGFAIMQIPAGYFLDKYKVHYVISSGVFILALGNLLISFTHTFSFFIIANFFQGLGASFAFVAAAKLISQWFSEKLFPILFGLTQTLSCILSAVLHFMLMILLKSHSWNSLYLYLALFGFSLFILIVLFVKSPETAQEKTTLSLLQSLKLVSKNTQLWLCSVAAACSFGILLVYASFWYKPIQEFYGVNEIQSSLISGMIFLGIGIGTPLLGLISNSCASRKMIIHISLLLGTIFLLLGLYLPHFNFGSLLIIKIVSFGIGLLLSGSMLFYTVVSELSSNTTRGISLSITNTTVFLFNSFLMFLPPLFITRISTQFFTYLWVLPSFILIAVILLYFIQETYPENIKESTHE